MTIPTEYYKEIRREKNLVTYWRMNEVAGVTRAIDYAAKYNINGIYNNQPLSDIALISGDTSAGSKRYGEKGQNMEVPNIDVLQITGDISIEFWIMLYKYNESGAIVGKRGSSEPLPGPYAIGLTSGKLYFGVGNGVSETSIGTPNIIKPTMPIHILATSFRNKMKIFVNGVEEANQTIGSEVKDKGNALFVGALENGNERTEALISELAIYNGALSGATAKKHFALGRQILFNKPLYNTYDRPSYS